VLDKTILDKTHGMLLSMANGLLKRGITANQVTVAGFIVGMLAVPLIIVDQMILALILIILNRLLDGLDGTLARLSTPTDRGGFLDIVLDFIFYSAIPLAFAIANPADNALAAAFLIYAFIGTGCSFLAFATIAAKRQMDSTRFPDKSFYYLGGLTEATETIILFGIMCLLPNYFSLLAYSFAFLCLITTVLRIKAGLELFD